MRWLAICVVALLFAGTILLLIYCPANRRAAMPSLHNSDAQTVKETFGDVAPVKQTGERAAPKNPLIRRFIDTRTGGRIVADMESALPPSTYRDGIWLAGLKSQQALADTRGIGITGSLLSGLRYVHDILVPQL